MEKELLQSRATNRVVEQYAAPIASSNIAGGMSASSAYGFR
jgi:hypothetical protein